MRTMTGTWLAGLAALAIACAPARADGPPPRTVSVTGSGEVSAAPDLARLTLGVEARKPTLAEARAEVTAAVERVLALTRTLKIDPKRVNATRLQVSPLYSWDEKSRRQLLEGYLVSRQVEVELRDLDQLGTLIEKAVDAGVNQLGDPQLDSSRRKDLEREAMAKAVLDARSNAEALANAAGVKVGLVRNLNGQSSAGPVPMYRRAPQAAMVADGSAAETYQAGDMKFVASVSAEYDLVVGP